MYGSFPSGARRGQESVPQGLKPASFESLNVWAEAQTYLRSEDNDRRSEGNDRRSAGNGRRSAGNGRRSAGNGRRSEGNDMSLELSAARRGQG